MTILYTLSPCFCRLCIDLVHSYMLLDSLLFESPCFFWSLCHCCSALSYHIFGLITVTCLPSQALYSIDSAIMVLAHPVFKAHQKAYCDLTVANHSYMYYFNNGGTYLILQSFKYQLFKQLPPPQSEERDGVKCWNNFI